MKEKTKTFRDSFISVNNTIKETIKNISDSGYQIALVVDNNSKLLGTITDGDIRRGILSGINLDDSVKKIINKEPTKIFSEEINLALDLMIEKKINQVPVVNLDNQVIDLKTLVELKHKSPIENFFVIMAGGFGTRLGKLTKNCPKPMIKVLGKPILEHIILNAKNQGFKNFLITTHYLEEQIKTHFQDGSEFGIHIEYLSEKKPMGTAGSLSLLKEKFSSPFILSNGDILTKIDYNNFLTFHQNNKSKLSVAVKHHEEKNPFGVIESKNGFISDIIEKPVYQSLVNAGIYIINPEILKLLKKSIPFTMPELIIKAKHKGIRSRVYPIYENWLDIGRNEDLSKVSQLF